MIANSFTSTNICHAATKQCGTFILYTNKGGNVGDVKGTGCDAKGYVHEAFSL